MKSVHDGVWLFLDSSSIGGIETHVMQLACGLASMGVNTTLALYQAYQGSPVPELLHDLKDSDQSGLLHLHILDGRPTGLYHLLRAHTPPALIHTHGYKAGLIGRLTGRLSGIPIASTWHAGEVPVGLVRLYDFLDRYSAFLAQLRFAVSPQIQARLPASAQVMDNFVDLSDLRLSTGQQLAFVGRLSHEKGPDVMSELASLMPEQVFHMYGGGEMEAGLQQSAPDNLQLHGMQTNMKPVWEQVGLMVMPSRFEGLPMAVLEAMARGIPVVASDVGALSSVIRNGENGWLVTPADATALSQAIQHWLALPEDSQQRIRQAARQAIEERFSSTAVIPEFIAAYQSVAPELDWNQPAGASPHAASNEPQSRNNA